MPNLLDVDSSILERSLLLKELQEGDGSLSPESLFNVKPKDPDDIPWKPVKPNPGYCVKLRTFEGDKVFVNICYTDAMPEPVEISEEKLLQMIMDDDVPSFRIPISIGDLHIESDKSRNPCSVYDIAVNTKFFNKMDSSEVFNTFFLNVSIQALQEKYSLNLDLKSEKPFLLLKNRKVLGTLQVHRIQQRDVKKAPGELIQELDSKPTPKKNLIEIISEEETSTKDVSRPAFSSKQNNPIKSLSINDNKLISKNDSVDKVKSSPTSSIKSKSKNHEDELNKAHTPIEDCEKGIQECRSTKTSTSKVLKKTKIEISKNSEQSSDYRKLKAEPLGIGLVERGGGNATTAIKDDRRSSDGPDNCSSLFCLKQYPETGYPEFLVASIRINAKSSKDFDLQLDENRLNISLVESKKPWFDVHLPYNIDVTKVNAYFVTESQKLMVRMDVVKS